MGSWGYPPIYIYSFGDLKAECTDQGKNQEYHHTPHPDSTGELGMTVKYGYHRRYCCTDGDYWSHEHDEDSSCGENG